MPDITIIKEHVHGFLVGLAAGLVAIAAIISAWAITWDSGPSPIGQSDVAAMRTAQTLPQCGDGASIEDQQHTASAALDAGVTPAPCSDIPDGRNQPAGPSTIVPQQDPPTPDYASPTPIP